MIHNRVEDFKREVAQEEAENEERNEKRMREEAELLNKEYTRLKKEAAELDA